LKKSSKTFSRRRRKPEKNRFFQLPPTRDKIIEISELPPPIKASAYTSSYSFTVKLLFYEKINNKID